MIFIEFVLVKEYKNNNIHNIKIGLLKYVEKSFI